MPYRRACLSWPSVRASKGILLVYKISLLARALGLKAKCARRYDFLYTSIFQTTLTLSLALL